MSNSQDTLQAIKASFTKWTQALNRADADGYLDAYWKSDQTRWVSGGKVVVGFDNIKAEFYRRFMSSQDLGTTEIGDLQADILTDDTALVFGHYKQISSDDVITTGVFTVHLRKINGSWQIVSDHATQLNR